MLDLRIGRLILRESFDSPRIFKKIQVLTKSKMFCKIYRNSFVSSFDLPYHIQLYAISFDIFIFVPLIVSSKKMSLLLL